MGRNGFGRQRTESGNRGCGLALAWIGTEVFGLLLFAVFDPGWVRWIVGVIAVTTVSLLVVIWVRVLRGHAL